MHKDFAWSGAEASAFLRAMKSVATVGGRRPLAAIDRAMLEATREHVLHGGDDVDALPVIAPPELAAAVPEPERRRQALQFAILMPYATMDVARDKVAIVDSFAAALGIAPDTLADLHRVRDGRLRRLALDYGRRTAKQLLPGASFTGKLKNVLEIVHQYRGAPKVAARFARLGDLPAGTLGRTFFDFYRARGFPLPGEKGSFTEFLVPHDMSHILGGFNTDMKGEIDVAGFEAGMSRKEIGYELLLEVILDFHCGLAFSTAGIVPPGRGQMDPDSMLAAYERGAAMSLDLLVGWDWWSVVDQPVLALRERYGIRGVEGVNLPAPTTFDAHPSRAAGTSLPE